MSTSIDDLTPAEREALDRLDREIPPPDGLEDRTVAALRREGLLDAGGGWHPGALRLALSGVAVAAIFALGLGVGRWSVPAPVTPDYVMILRAAPAERQARGSEELATRVREYSEWAGRLAAAGRLVAGEKLGDGGRLLEPGSGPSPAERAGREEGSIQGYFLLRSGSLEEAVRLAEGCPHLAYGGTIELRKIDRLPDGDPARS